MVTTTLLSATNLTSFVLSSVQVLFNTVKFVSIIIMRWACLHVTTVQWLILKQKTFLSHLGLDSSVTDGRLPTFFCQDEEVSLNIHMYMYTDTETAWWTPCSNAHWWTLDLLFLWYQRSKARPNFDYSTMADTVHVYIWKYSLSNYFPTQLETQKFKTQNNFYNKLFNAVPQEWKYFDAK